jgi:transposase
MTKTSAHRRHDISDKMWALLEPHLPSRKGTWARIARDNRAFINIVFWIMRTGAPWRDLPPDYGDWSNTHRRFIRWRDQGMWEKLLEVLIEEPDYEWLMIDASHCQVHPHAAGARGGNQGMSRTVKRITKFFSEEFCRQTGSTQNCISPWMHMVCWSGLLLHKVQQQIALKQVA